jgi:hypothetical protein
MPPPARYKGILVNSKGESVNIRKLSCTGTLLKETKRKGGNPVSSTALFGHPNIRRTEKTKIISIYIPYFQLSGSPITV